MKKLLFLVLLFSHCCVAEQEENTYQVLCYHDIPNTVEDDEYGVDTFSFVRQIEFLKRRGYHFISMEDVRQARKGFKKLPPKAMLLTFDDGYRTFMTNALPILEQYQIPAVLAIVTSWLDHPPKPEKKWQEKIKFLNREELKKVAQSPLVEIACHTHDSHKAVLLNEYGNTTASMVTHQYFKNSGFHESTTEYQQRIYQDLKQSSDILYELLGKRPKVMVWPYGKYTKFAIEEAEKVGLTEFFTLDEEYISVDEKRNIGRFLMSGNPPESTFKYFDKVNFNFTSQLRILEVDVNNVFRNDQERQKKKIDQFIEKIYQFKPGYVMFVARTKDDMCLYPLHDKRFKSRHERKEIQYFSHLTRACNMRGIGVFLQLEKKDLFHIEAILKNSFIQGVYIKGVQLEQIFIDRIRHFAPEAIIITDFPSRIKDKHLFQLKNVISVKKLKKLKGKQILVRSNNPQVILKALAAGKMNIISEYWSPWLSTHHFTVRKQ